jgi:hypothetical protein
MVPNQDVAWTMAVSLQLKDKVKQWTPMIRMVQLPVEILYGKASGYPRP